MKDWCCERNGVGCNCDYNPDMTPEENRMADAIMRENVLNKETFMNSVTVVQNDDKKWVVVVTKFDDKLKTHQRVKFSPRKDRDSAVKEARRLSLGIAIPLVL